MKIILTTSLMFSAFMLMGQTHNETIRKELSYETTSASNALVVANINGSISIVPHSGAQIIVEVIKSINAKTTSRLAKGISDIQLGAIDRADTLILFVEGLCNSFGRSAKSGNEWSYQWNDCNSGGCNKEYDYAMDFKIKVPANVNLILSTVNNGDIQVENINGVITVKNVNGSIKLTNLTQKAIAHTINGNVDITYASNPKADCKFYTLNGDINAYFQKGLAANMSFESFNGSFYTNINSLHSLPVTVEKKNTGEGIKYKINDNQYRVGTGGAHLDFETFNGDVYLKEVN